MKGRFILRKSRR